MTDRHIDNASGDIARRAQAGIRPAMTPCQVADIGCWTLPSRILPHIANLLAMPGKRPDGDVIGSVAVFSPTHRRLWVSEVIEVNSIPS